MERFTIGHNEEHVKGKNIDELKLEIDRIASKYPESEGYYRVDAIVVFSWTKDLPKDSDSVSDSECQKSIGQRDGQA
ncbi:MAG: hypothetical protein RR854_00400 [Muribaculaceae bacterium]